MYVEAWSPSASGNGHVKGNPDQGPERGYVEYWSGSNDYSIVHTYVPRYTVCS